VRVAAEMKKSIEEAKVAEAERAKNGRAFTTSAKASRG